MLGIQGPEFEPDVSTPPQPYALCSTRCWKPAYLLCPPPPPFRGLCATASLRSRANWALCVLLKQMVKARSRSVDPLLHSSTLKYTQVPPHPAAQTMVKLKKKCGNNTSHCLDKGVVYARPRRKKQ